MIRRMLRSGAARERDRPPAGAHDAQARPALAGRAAAAEHLEQHVVEEDQREHRRGEDRGARVARRPRDQGQRDDHGRARIAKSITPGDEARADVGQRQLDLDALGRRDREPVLVGDRSGAAGLRRCSYSLPAMDVDRFTRERAAGWEELAALVRQAGPRPQRLGAERLLRARPALPRGRRRPRARAPAVPAATR